MLARYNLMSKSTLAALLITLVIAAISAWLIQGQLVGRDLEQAAESAAQQVANVLDPSVTTSDLKGAASEVRLGEIDNVVSRNILAGPVVRVQIINPDGKLVYSNDHERVGDMIPVEGGLKDALDGRTAFEGATLEAGDTDGGEHSGDLLLVYAPVSSTDPEAGEAAYEIYYDLEGTKGDITSLRFFVWGGVLAGCLLVFAVSFLMGRLFARRPAEAEAAPAEPVGGEREQQAKQDERSDEYALLYGIARDLSRAGPSLDETLGVIVREAVENIHVTFACVLLVQGDDILKQAAHPARILSTSFGLGEKTPLGELTAISSVIESKEPLLADPAAMRDLTETERQVLLFDISRTVYLAPVIAGGEVAAVLMLGESRDAEREPLTDEKTILARGLADLTADVLSRSEGQDEPEEDSDSEQA